MTYAATGLSVLVVVAAVVALLAGLLHVFIFYLESVAWTRPSTWRRFGVASQADADTTRPMAFNQGFYNLFLAIGAILGAVLLLADQRTVGLTLVLVSCGSMLLAAIVLLSTGASYLRAALTQGTLPAVAVICALLALL